KLSYGGLHVTDANRRELPSALAVRDEQVFIEVNDRAAVYPVTIDPVFTTSSRITAGDATERDAFGVAVAISGDTAVVGSVADVDPGVSHGSAYVFVRSGTGWAQQQKLTVNDATSRGFGFAVAV